MTSASAVLQTGIAALIRRFGYAAVKAAVDAAAPPPKAASKPRRGRPPIGIDGELPALRKAAQLWRAAGKPDEVWPYLQAAAESMERHAEAASVARRLYDRLRGLPLIETMRLRPGDLMELARTAQGHPKIRPLDNWLNGAPVAHARIAYLASEVAGFRNIYTIPKELMSWWHVETSNLHAALCIFLLDALPEDNCSSEICSLFHIIEHRPDYVSRLKQLDQYY